VNPIEVSAIIFCCIFGGAVFGIWLRKVLPEHHLNTDNKELMKLAVGLVGTMSALLLGLLVASAKSSYDQRSGELTQMAANIILLDRALAHYGPATSETRAMLRASVARLIDQVWSKDRQDDAAPQQAGMEVVFDRVQELVPRNEAQHMLQSQAESILMNFGQARSLLFAQSGSSISAPFLVVVVFWLTVLFVSFGLFAPANATALVTLLVSAISVAAALFLIMELDRPFSGVIQISSAPLRNALSALGH
jgi:Protein of unknown function (DUF4239)